MASWKDGAAYAPIERPDGFATPVVDALPSAEPFSAETPGPLAAPSGFETTSQPTLQSVGHHELARRNPRDEFAVASLSLTQMGGQGSKRDPRTGFSLSSASHAGTEAPPTGEPLALTTPPPPWRPAGQQAPSPAGPPGQAWPPPQTSQQWPQPAQQQWTQPAQAPRGRDASRTLCVIGSVVSFFGLLIGPAAPLLLLVSAALGLRTKARTPYLAPIALTGGLASLLLQLMSGDLGGTSVLATFVTLVVLVWYIVGASRSL